MVFPLLLAAGLFTDPKWFQIKFCQEIKHLTVQANNSGAGKLPAFGLATDWAKPEGVIHYYEWDLLAGAQTLQFDIPVAPDIPAVALRMAAVSSDQRRLLIANSSHELILFDRVQKQVLARFSGHRFGTDFAAFSPDGKRVAAIGNDRNVWIWDVDGEQATPVQVLEVEQYAGRVEFLEGSAKIKLYGEVSTQVFDLATGKALLSEPRLNKLLVDRMHRPETITPLPRDDSYAAEVDMQDSQHGAIGVFKRTTNTALWTLDLGQIQPPVGSGMPSTANQPNGYAVSPNGQCLVIGEWQGYRVMDPATGKEIFRQKVNAAGYYLLFSPDGKYMIDTGGCDVMVYKVPAACGGE